MGILIHPFKDSYTGHEQRLMRIELSPKLPTHDIAMEGCYAACIEHYLLCQAIVAGVAAPGDLSKPVG